ncbi:acyl carrier protein [Streptomyces sp. DSM 44915]|uniref:Acyl carrier protein n=1 Tax=Streptomyces chisholmiae TaxID=3075540 RepID=A0ABU2JQS8_9ACTN|nr:acyl carrier protein [Streptomyces sp. DSM 44915]MDT0267347.1 acyl carrier protein [Streptomyces sp. DSM 44915]
MSDTVTPGADDVAGTIAGFITDRFPQAELSDDQDIFALGYINSLFAMELVMFVERTFSLTIPNQELAIDNFRTVAAMTALVGRLRPAVAAGGAG